MGATADDVRSQQAFIASESTNLARAVATVQLDAARSKAWDDLARQCLRFTSREPVFGLVGSMYVEGLGLLGKLSWWRASLASMGVSVPETDWSQAPHVAPPPGPGLIEQLSSSFGPFLLLAAWAYFRGPRR